MLDNAKLPFSINTGVKLSVALMCSCAIKRWGLPPNSNIRQDKKITYGDAVFYTNLATQTIFGTYDYLSYKKNLNQGKYTSLIPKFTIMLGSGYKGYLLYDKYKNEKNVNKLMLIRDATDIINEIAQYLLSEHMIACRTEKKNPSSTLKILATYAYATNNVATMISLISNFYFKNELNNSSKMDLFFSMLYRFTTTCSKDLTYLLVHEFFKNMTENITVKTTGQGIYCEWRSDEPQSSDANLTGEEPESAT